MRTLFAWTLLSFAACADAKPVWELTPYRVEIRTAFARRPELTPRFQSDFQARLAERLQALQGRAWSVRVAPAASSLRPAMLARIAEIAADAVLKESADCDKLLLLAVSWADGYRVTAREFDVRTQTWSAPVVRLAPQPAKLGDAAAVAVCEAFAPLARFSALDGQRAALRPRASALVPRSRQPRPVEPGDAFMPIVRSAGEVDRPASIVTIPRTLCIVEEVRDDGLQCRLECGVRGPLDGHLNGKAEWLALGVRRPQTPVIHAADSAAPGDDAIEAAARQALERRYKSAK